MRLVLRRMRGARSLLLAAVLATLIAISFVVGLLAYGQEVVSEAARSTIAAAAPDERSLVLRGSATAGGTDLATKDAALREMLAPGIGGRPVQVSAAGYGAGWQLTGPTGDAVGDDDGIVYANVMFLDDLSSHATLLRGSWARPGQATTEATLPRVAASVLGVEVGDRVPVTDRRTDEATDVLVTGVWEATDPNDPFWLLVPGVDAGVAPGGHSYGPLALDRSDFLSDWRANASVGWVLRPDLEGAGLPELTRVAADLRSLADLPERVGFGEAGQVTGRVGRLVDRLGAADLVGRSSLLTPVLLVVVLGGYALLLIAMLLNEHRRGETALIRARGASRPQLGGFAIREAALLVVPAVALAPPLTSAALRWAGLASSTGPQLWIIAAVIGLLCAVAMVGPSARRSGTYIEELGARSRPSRFAFAQRVGVDVALVALAALAWFQLRQYSSPLTGVGRSVGIDPLLVAAPTIGVLAGAVLSLRLLPRVTRLAERLVDRRHWPATMFGMWQAGRRPHAGPVLLLALAVAVSTLAWSMLGTSQRSLVDQADFAVGADLRLVEANGFSPAGRTEQVGALPGVATMAPVSRSALNVGPQSTSTELIGIDVTTAGEIVRYREDLGGGPELFAALAAARPELPVLPVPEGATRFALTMAATVQPFEPYEDPFCPECGPITTPAPVIDFGVALALVADDGHLIRVPVGTVRSGQDARRFEVDLPAIADLDLARISINLVGDIFTAVHWSLTGIQTAAATGEWSSWDLTMPGGWAIADVRGQPVGSVDAGDGAAGISSVYEAFNRQSPAFAVIPAADAGPVPVAVTPDALRALGVEVGGTADLAISGARVTLLIVDEVIAVPGTTRSPSAILADLPSLEVAIVRQRAGGLNVAEHWVSVGSGESTALSRAAADLGGLRVLDRTSQAEAADRDPYGRGGRSALFVAGLGALLLALIGIAVDVRATARRRVGEFAVLQTMGAGSRLLARAVLAEQGFLAGLGVLVGLGVGIAVAATLAPLVILTPTADRPEPPALLSVPWPTVLGTAAGLFVASMVLSGAVAATLGRRLAVARLRIGDET